MPLPRHTHNHSVACRITCTGGTHTHTHTSTVLQPHRNITFRKLCARMPASYSLVDTLTHTLSIVLSQLLILRVSLRSIWLRVCVCDIYSQPFREMQATRVLHNALGEPMPKMRLSASLWESRTVSNVCTALSLASILRPNSFFASSHVVRFILTFCSHSVSSGIEARCNLIK